MARQPEAVYSWTDITKEFKSSVQGKYKKYILFIQTDIKNSK